LTEAASESRSQSASGDTDRHFRQFDSHDRASARGHLTRTFAIDNTAIRKGFLVAGLGGTGTCLALIGIHQAAAVPLLILSGVTTGLSGPMVFTIGQSLAGPRAGGRWMGIQNMIGNFSGILAPIVTGIVVDWTGSFTGAFLLAGAMSVIGTASWLLVVRDVREVAWRSVDASRKAPAL